MMGDVALFCPLSARRGFRIGGGGYKLTLNWTPVGIVSKFGENSLYSSGTYPPARGLPPSSFIYFLRIKYVESCNNLLSLPEHLFKKNIED